MGTNYYVENEVPCPTCGRGYEMKHIGKSSFGWCFSLHVIPEEGLNSLDDWKAYWEGKVIKNEYGDEISEEEMLSIITAREGQKTKDDDRWYKENHAVPGPNNLARHVLDGIHCIGHGEGTWDLITGEFS